MNLDEILSPLGGRLALLAMVLGVVGLGSFALMGRRLIEFYRYRSLRNLQPMRSLILLLLSVAFLAAGAAAAFLSTSLKTYTAFSQHTLVAVIECERITDNPDYDLLLRYIPHLDGQPGEPSHYLLKGDTWEVGGDILKWDPQLTLLGVRTCHKVTRISSHALEAEDEEEGSHSSYRLGGGTDRLWLWLHEYGDRLPFVEAVYGSAVFTLPTSDRAFELYVGPDGYSLKKLPRKKSS